MKEKTKKRRSSRENNDFSGKIMAVYRKCRLLSTYTPNSLCMYKVSRYIYIYSTLQYLYHPQRIITQKRGKKKQVKKRGAIVEQHTTAPFRYIPRRNGFNELSRIHRVLSEQSIVYDSDTRHLNRRAAIYSAACGKQNRLKIKQKGKENSRVFFAVLHRNIKKKMK